MDSLIRNISNQNLQDYFFHKISSFSSNEEALNYLIPENGYADFTGLNKLGEAELSDGDLLVFSCKYNGELSERTAKKKQYELAKKALKEDFKDGAIFVFYDNAGHFRFSFIQRNYDDEHQKYTPYKRYTYYIDPQKQNKTFRRRVGDGDFRSLKAIQKAFSVEPLSKQFYKELSHWYFAALGEVQFPNDRNDNEYNLHANAMIRLITRLMFVWFMKQKGLVPQDFFDKQRLDELLNYKDSTGSTYYKAILQNLFFATLNTPMGEKRKWVTTSGYGVQNFYRYKRFFKNPDAFLELTKDIPFLNGGLFENLDIVQTADPGKGIEKKDIRLDCFSDNPKNEGRLTVPDYLFFGTRKADISSYFEDNSKTDVEINGIIDILNRYDFTIDENTPEDQDVALDPELLGTVFENLLASYNPETQSTARKESGSFYTPRPIVDYMVKESIFYFLREKVDTNEDILKQLLHEEEPPAITDEERAPIIEALSSMTVLDPACGSGAFPMGGLQQIVRLLNILDPDNRHWKQAQIKLLQEQTQQAFENQSELEELKTRIDEIFANDLSNPDFKRKLFLIQNCLYGVDIQPIAMQITKLRFFISLLVEQQVDRSKDNHGILSLPNLETRFVAANTLIRPDKQQGTFKNVKIQILEEELHQIRERYFSARTPKTKRKYRTRDLEIRQQIAGLLQNDGFAEDVATKIAHWDPFNPNSKAEWFEPEWMFGISAFDVVIGNPPYVQLQKPLPGHESHKYADLYKKIGYKTFERTGDIYALFYEQGLKLTKATGVLSYITSNKWMRAKYGKSLRKYFAQKRPLQLIDLGPGIFEAATVDTNILLVQNRKTKSHALQALTLEHKRQMEQPASLPFATMEQLSEESWVVLTPEEMGLKAKIERIGTPLKNWDVKIYRGVLTGYNKAFIIDGKTKDQLIAEDPKSAEILKPILRGRDIKRYKAEFADLWLVATFPAKHIKIQDYPAIYQYLQGMRPKLEQTGQLLRSKDKQAMIEHGKHYGLELSFAANEKSRKKTSNQWFETQDQIGYWEEFEKEKIVYNDINQKLTFSLADPTTYFNNTVYFIANSSYNNFLLSVLNSEMMDWYYRRISAQLGSTAVRMFSIYVNNIPIPKIDPESQQLFIDLVDTILAKKAAGLDTTAEEAEIDLMVYKLYELSYEEVMVVDEEFGMSEEEYEKVDF